MFSWPISRKPTTRPRAAADEPAAGSIACLLRQLRRILDNQADVKSYYSFPCLKRGRHRSEPCARRCSRSSFAIAAVAIWSPALAGSDYTVADIVGFFVKERDLGAARGICIGTAQECKQEAPKPAGFDMLIHFALNSAALDQQAQANLDEFAKALTDERLKTAQFIVEGHTDATGTEQYNDKLSERRADAVTNYLVAQGVQPDRLTAIGLGEKDPRVPDPYDPVNRRVEMHINLQ